jgi:hypothetical protein
MNGILEQLEAKLEWSKTEEGRYKTFVFWIRVLVRGTGQTHVCFLRPSTLYTFTTKKRSLLWEDFFLKTKPQTDELFERFELIVVDLIETVEAEQEQDMADKYAGVKKGAVEVSSRDDLSLNALLYTIRLMRNMCVRCEINQVCFAVRT